MEHTFARLVNLPLTLFCHALAGIIRKPVHVYMQLEVTCSAPAAPIAFRSQGSVFDFWLIPFFLLPSSQGAVAGLPFDCCPAPQPLFPHSLLLAGMMQTFDLEKDKIRVDTFS
jgi:hypothetical protein